MGPLGRWERFALQGFMRLLGRKFNLQTAPRYICPETYLLTIKTEVSWSRIIQTTAHNG
jgi:hypothetical protein